MNVMVWDLPTRLFHWTLVVLFVAMWYTGKQGMLNLHILCGEAIAILLVFRILWGIIGSQTARFGDFVRGPSAVCRYVRGKMSEAEQPGHNPLGALMVVALLLALLVQVGTGLFSADIDSFVYDGPFAYLIGDKAQTVTTVHKQLFNGILVLVALHIMAIIIYAVFKKQNLVRAMLTGRKPIEDTVRPLYFAPMRYAVLCVCAASLFVVSILYFFK